MAGNNVINSFAGVMVCVESSKTGRIVGVKK